MKGRRDLLGTAVDRNSLYHNDAQRAVWIGNLDEPQTLPGLLWCQTHSAHLPPHPQYRIRTSSTAVCEYVTMHLRTPKRDLWTWPLHLHMLSPSAPQAGLHADCTILKSKVIFRFLANGQHMMTCPLPTKLLSYNPRLTSFLTRQGCQWHVRGRRPKNCPFVGTIHMCPCRMPSNPKHTEVS